MLMVKFPHKPKLNIAPKFMTVIFRDVFVMFKIVLNTCPLWG